MERAGFKSFDQGPITLRVADRIEVNAKLQVGQITERISVVADAALVETETGSRGQVIDNQRINDLPSNGRNPLQFCGSHSGCAVRGQHPDLLPAVRYATGLHDQRRPARRERDPDRRRAGQCDHLLYGRAAVRLCPAVRGHPGIQGADQHLRCPVRTDVRRCDQPLHQERHEQTARGRIRVPAAHRPDGQHLREQRQRFGAAQPRAGSVRLRARRPRVSAEGVPRPRPNVLHGRLREVSRRPAATGAGSSAHARTAELEISPRPTNPTENRTWFTIPSPFSPIPLTIPPRPSR